MKAVQLLLLGLLLGLFSLGAESTIHPSDASSLAAFYSGLSSKGVLSWATSADLCSTKNAGVFNFVPTVLCDSQNPQRVVALYLHSKQLGGNLPTLATLPFLTTLQLHGNSFTGGLPDFSSFTALQVLDVSSNSFSGAIPASLGSLSSLVSLDLSSNGFTGALPAALGGLTALQSLSIGGNSLTASIPVEFGQLVSLTTFFASKAGLIDTIPTQIFKLPLQQLVLSGNSLKGGISPSLGQATKLDTLDLSGNTGLGGSIPLEIGSLTKLAFLDVSNCGLSNSIPTQVGLLSNLDTFIVSNNALSGQIPAQIASCPFLTDLRLNSNSFTGTVPAALSTLPLSNLNLFGGSNSFCPLPNYGAWSAQNDYPGAQDCSACNPTPCVHGTCTFISNTFGCSCPTSYYGATCQNQYTCPANYRNNADYPITAGGSVATGVCSVGWSGSPTRSCGPTGTWSSTTNNNCFKVCQASVAKNATFLQTVNGNTATGICDPGLLGTVTRFCYTNGTWGPIIGSCMPQKCTADNAGTGNANWLATNPGVTASGTCLSGFVGSPTRLCQANGTWASVSNPCIIPQCPVDNTTGNATWLATDPGTTATGTCLPGFTGSPTRLCQADGTWSSTLTSGSCAPLRCPVEFYAHTNFTEGGTPGQWVNGTCERGYFGYGTRFCQSNGVWSNNFGARCTAYKCQPVDENFVNWPLTMFDLIVNRNCPAGYTGRPSRTCGDDGNWGPISNPCISI